MRFFFFFAPQWGREIVWESEWEREWASGKGESEKGKTFRLRNNSASRWFFFLLLFFVALSLLWFMFALAKSDTSRQITTFFCSFSLYGLPKKKNERRKKIPRFGRNFLLFHAKKITWSRLGFFSFWFGKERKRKRKIGKEIALSGFSFVNSFSTSLWSEWLAEKMSAFYW